MSDERAVSCIGGTGGLATNGHQQQHGTGHARDEVRWGGTRMTSGWRGSSPAAGPEAPDIVDTTCEPRRGRRCMVSNRRDSQRARDHRVQHVIDEVLEA